MTEWNGKKIKELRKNLELTQQEFAEEVGVVKQQTVSDWENDRTKPRGSVRKLFSIMEERALYGVEKQ